MADRADETTPLITVVHVTQPPRRRRYPHNRVRRVCSWCLGLLLLFCLTASIVTLMLVPECKENHRNRKLCLPKHPFYRDHGSRREWLSENGEISIRDTPSKIGYDDLLAILGSTPNETMARKWSEYYTAGPHLAGKNQTQANYTQDLWDEFGIPHTEIVPYEVYLNYPVGHSLTLLEQSSKKNTKGNWTVKFSASLEEDILDDDDTSGLEDRVPTFHGYSASGNVTGQYVFVNYGTYHDYEDLVAANITLKGNIAIAKYGKIFRGLKVKRAQELGMIGVIIYTDPGDDGEVTEEAGYKPYPEGKARNPSSVQRGSVQYLSFQPGDPTTPGYPSKPGCPRVSANFSTPSIPSLPISYEDAIPILKSLEGHGPKASSLGKYWKDGGLGYKGVKYYVGPSPNNTALNLVNEQEYVITPIWNVIGVINGSISNEVVVLGNHRDAWIAGGAGDPNSGSSALNEVVRSFGVALAAGWKPLRTIVFASWDGEEYGLIGSTEWVEEYLPWLNGTVVAYLNVDVGTRGPQFTAAASPLLNGALIEATKLVLSPNVTVPGQTIYDLWDKKIHTMGSGSDFTAFQDYAGIPSIDMGFTVSPDSPVYHYHSNYDSFHWMETYGDPGFSYHVAITKVWSILAANLVESPIVPLNVTDYVDALAVYLDRVKEKLANSTDAELNGFAAPKGPLDGLTGSIARLRNASISFDAEAAAASKKLAEDPPPWWKWWERVALAIKVRKINTTYKLFERSFLYKKGLDGRSWFKHVIFAPGRWTGYAGETFPGLMEAIDSKSPGGLWKWSSIILGLVEQASAKLVAPPEVE